MQLLQLIDVVDATAPNGDTISTVGEVFLVHNGPVVGVGAGGQEPAGIELLLHEDVAQDADGRHAQAEQQEQDLDWLLQQEVPVSGEDFFAHGSDFDGGRRVFTSLLKTETLSICFSIPIG